MTDEAVQNRRALIKRKKLQHRVSLPAGGEAGLSSEQQLLIKQLMEAQERTFDRSFSNFHHFRPIRRTPCSSWDSFECDSISPDGQCSRGGMPEETHLSTIQQDVAESVRPGSYSTAHTTHGWASPEVFSMLPHIADLSTYMIKGAISFAKVSPHFRQLVIEDQIALLKGATFELCQMRFNTLFNPASGTWECGKLEYDINDCLLSGFKALLLDPLLKFHYMLKKLNLQNEEYVLMQAISLFSSDRPGVKHNQTVDQLQEMYALTLKAFIDCKRPHSEKKFLFPKIIQCLTELRSMNVEYCKQIVEIHEIQPDNTPLIMEVFSGSND